ncbi:class I SAM-dependent methyltransferase [Flammeovirga sp. MY04]|uniref:class I SAM-dependent methyltransferase n=1 Tax=Flammeovirga sp. MY04 TaxID=1191459 RepID=UPI0008063A29|nr:class I SAM-dependent methyltransferase [Flammeovirga sp. MY04]ANQ47560.1 class I SAM-dependent methyltransferase [Flammeovirga sp. MY04]
MIQGNVAFYQNMPIQVFKKFADQIGLANGEDLDQVYNTIKEGKEIMEFGSGYGRIVKGLKDKGYNGKLYAVEIVDALIDKLSLQKTDNIEIIHSDLTELEWKNDSLDYILWMWSGILELTEDEQQAVIKKAYKWLKKGGALIIECPMNKAISKVGMLSNDKKIVVEEEWGVLNATLVEAEDVALYSSKAGFESHSLQTYTTTTNLTRAIYTLKK